MTRTLSIADTSCSICKNWYETVEEAIDCEEQCEREQNAEIAAYEDDVEWEALTYADEQRALAEQEHWEADDEYLTSLHGFEFGRP